MAEYDYIITGAGAAGLSLLVHIIRSGKFSDKRILLLDREPKIHNDRTWCFWEREPGLFEDVVYKKWSRLAFHGIDAYEAVHGISPYEYKLIRGLDFYRYCFELIGSCKNVTVRYGDVERCVSDLSGTYVVVDGQKVHGDYIFNSILFNIPSSSPGAHFLLQHFKGWFIQTDASVFDPSTATLMDFRVSQEHGTTFVYIMPFSATEALVEYTLFSKRLLPDAGYDLALKNYCTEVLGLRNYQLSGIETGSIPMTDQRFPATVGNITNIGTAGGQTKASTGYTFQFIQKHSAALVRALTDTGEPFLASPSFPSRFYKYDSILLDVLDKQRVPGAEIFTTLMRRNDMRQVLKFLDNETSIGEDLKIISSLPTLVFLKSAMGL